MINVEFDCGLRIKNYFEANVDYENSEVKPELVVGGIYLVTGRILATGDDSRLKW
jgi:hypothetical protein